MAMTYKQLGIRGRQLYERIKSEGFNESLIADFENKLDIFWSRAGKKKGGLKPKSKSRISFSKDLTAKQRREMAGIVNWLLKQPRITKLDIEREYREKVQKYIDDLSPKSKEQRIKQLKENKNAKEMNETIELLDRIIKDRKVVESLGSEIVKYIYQRSVDSKLNVSDFENAVRETVDHLDTENRLNELLSFEANEMYDVFLDIYNTNRSND